MENKGLKGFWKNFESTMNGLGQALEEELDNLKTSAQKTAEEVKKEFRGATSVSNNDGNIVIIGDIKSLTVNGDKIELKKKV